MTTAMYHGSSDEAVLHLGLCLTDDLRSAVEYADYGSEGIGNSVCVVTDLELDLTGLTVVEVAGYSAEGNVAPGDNDEDYGADVIVYTDQTCRGREHTTYRLMTQRALDACMITASYETDDI